VNIRRILVPVDFSKASLAGLDYAMQLGKRFNATLTVLFVAEPLYNAGDLGLFLEEQRHFGRDELARLALRLKKRRMKCHTVVRTGAPYQVIDEEAARSNADLIVLATHGRTGLSHLLMGSVAAKVVRTARCPVLTVRPNKNSLKLKV
jgi:nucleotide-binding universal stress UspA family protein